VISVQGGGGFSSGHRWGILGGRQGLRDKYVELEETLTQLKAENAKLKEQLKSEKIKSVNKNANRPSSKQAEWEEKGVGNDGKGKKMGSKLE